MKQPGAALIVLALCLVCPAPGSAAGNQQDAQYPPNFPQHPHAIICAIPGHDPRPILVPDGRNPTDFCPASLTTARIYTNYPVPIVSGVLPPPLSDEDTGGGH